MELTAAIFQGIVNDAGIAPIHVEYLIDYALSQLSLHSREDLPTMGGTAGSKTVSLTTQQYGAVVFVAEVIYNDVYKGRETVTIQGLTTGRPNLEGNPTIQAAIEKAARQLAEFDVDYG